MSIVATLFEVMDKEPSLIQVWTLFLTLGIGGFLLCRYRSGLMTIVLPAVILFAAGHFMEMHDPFVGPAIVREAGQGYVTQSYIAMALAVALPFLGIVTRKTKLL